MSKIHAMAFFEHPHGQAKVSFSDRECTIPNTHPVIADARGQFPPIFFPDPQWWNTTDCTTYNWRMEALMTVSPMGPQAAIGVCQKCGGTGVASP
jgi:hypothetical protein